MELEMQKKVLYKFIGLFLVILFIVSVSCSKKESPPPKVQEIAEDTAVKAAPPSQPQANPSNLFSRAQQFHSGSDQVFLPETNYTNAIRTYKEVVQLAPNSSLAPRAQYMASKLTEEYIRFVNRRIRVEIETLAVTPEEKSFDNILKNMIPFDDAINEYIKLAEMYPNSFHAPESLFRAAQLLTEDYNINKDYERAIDLYKKLIENFSNSGFEDYAQYRIGDCYRYLNNIPQAIEAYDNLIQQYPNSQYLLEAENKKRRLSIQLN
jgi:tetratricopeptide (TPR) repeat protein